MRDRLSHLREVSDASASSSGGSHGLEPMDCAESTASDSFSNVDLEEELPHQAVIFDNSPALEEVFSQVQDVHREVQLIRLDVKRLREQNSRVLHSSTDRMSTLNGDSNAIAGDIKARAEGVLTRLRDMDASAAKLEAEHGADAAVTRIARSQYACLSNGFRDAMYEYNEAEMSHRDSCTAHIQRQMEIVGRTVTGAEVEEMIETGRWDVFTGNILSEGKTAKSAMNQIECRHQELLELESRIQSIHEIFLDVAMLVEEQNPVMNAIQVNIHNTDMDLKEAVFKLERAKSSHNNNPFKKMFCGCFPCFK